MRIVTLTNQTNIVAFVDDQDFDKVSLYRWNLLKGKNGVCYAITTEKQNGKKVTLRMHRLITNCPPGKVVDHKDGDGLNNQQSNLRITDVRGNSQNLHIPKTSRFPGVWRHAKKWRVEIMLPSVIVKVRKRVTLGRFDLEEEAYKAYVAAEDRIRQGLHPKLNQRLDGTPIEA